MIKKKQKIKQTDNSFCSCQTDPSGSYTGVPADSGETPVQDADDL